MLKFIKINIYYLLALSNATPPPNVVIVEKIPPVVKLSLDEQIAKLECKLIQQRLEMDDTEKKLQQLLQLHRTLDLQKSSLLELQILAQNTGNSLDDILNIRNSQ